MPRVEPYHAPYPNAIVGWTGAIWHCLSVDGTGRLQVRGEDQLFSFGGVLAVTRTVAISGAGGYVDSVPCDAGEIWGVTNVYANDLTSPTTRHAYDLRHNGAAYGIGEVVAAFAAGVGTYWSGWVWLDSADVIRVYFVGGLAGDSCIVRLVGYRMTLEA